MRTPPSLLADLLRSDPARPRLTFYDDAPGPTQGERIELSARVFGNWVAKVANALQEELDVGPGSVVRLDLPAHWRTVYWAFAVWSVGATVDLRQRPAGGPGLQARAADVLVTADASALPGGPLVLVTLAALARSAPGRVPPGAMDEARELATYGDRFDAWAEPEPADTALVTDAGLTTYADLVPAVAESPQLPRVGLSGTPAQLLAGLLGAWAQDGSVVVVRDPDPDRVVARTAEEGITAWSGLEAPGGTGETGASAGTGSSDRSEETDPGVEVSGP